MTVEDPIEFLHARERCQVNQREVEEDAKSFANAPGRATRRAPGRVPAAAPGAWGLGD
jgi:twitching motility protein PilT